MVSPLAFVVRLVSPASSGAQLAQVSVSSAYEETTGSLTAGSVSAQTHAPRVRSPNW